MAGRLAGKVAVVTGAASRGEGVGNGMATAIMFAREGAKVVLVNRSAERAEKLAKQIREEGGEASVFAGDIAKAEVAEAMAEVASTLCQSAGVTVSGVPGAPMPSGPTAGSIFYTTMSCPRPRRATLHPSPPRPCLQAVRPFLSPSSGG